MEREGQGYPCYQHDMMMMMIYFSDNDILSYVDVFHVFCKYSFSLESVWVIVFDIKYKITYLKKIGFLFIVHFFMISSKIKNFLFTFS